MTITKYNKKGHPSIKHISDEEVRDMKLDYINNFLTVSAFAEYYGISYYSAKRIAEL